MVQSTRHGYEAQGHEAEAKPKPLVNHEAEAEAEAQMLSSYFEAFMKHF